MKNSIQIRVPDEIYSYLWSRYLPETTFKTYGMIGYLQMENLTGEEATTKLLNSDLYIESEVGILRKEKERVLTKLGCKYPESRTEDIEILLKFNLVRIGMDQNGSLMYYYNLPVPKPEEVLNLDNEEKQALDNIRFEFNHQHDINAVLTFILDSNSRLSSTLEHIHNTTEISHSDIKLVLEYLSKEGSINVTADKPINNLRKEDKVYISINKDIFEEKRFIIE